MAFLEGFLPFFAFQVSLCIPYLFFKNWKQKYITLQPKAACTATQVFKPEYALTLKHLTLVKHSACRNPFSTPIIPFSCYKRPSDFHHQKISHFLTCHCSTGGDPCTPTAYLHILLNEEITKEERGIDFVSRQQGEAVSDEGEYFWACWLYFLSPWVRWLFFSSLLWSCTVKVNLANILVKHEALVFFTTAAFKC